QDLLAFPTRRSSDLVAKAVATAKQAGIKSVMVTGDHPMTAAAIAKQIGIVSNAVVTGKDLDEMDDEELQQKVEDVHIFARVSPRSEEHTSELQSREN